MLGCHDFRLGLFHLKIIFGLVAAQKSHQMEPYGILNGKLSALWEPLTLPGGLRAAMVQVPPHSACSQPRWVLDLPPPPCIPVPSLACLGSGKVTAMTETWQKMPSLLLGNSSTQSHLSPSPCPGPQTSL